MEAERMNHDMRESEARFRALCEFSPVGIFRTDPEGFCTYTSPTWNEIFGLAPSESLGDAWATSIHPEDRANIFECWKHAALSKVDFKYEFRLMRTPSDIRYVSVQARPILNSAFEVSGHIGVVEDITNRKILAADIQLERDRLRSLVDGTRVGTWEWNVQTGEVRINDLWATMIGYSLEELAPFSIDTWIKLTHPDDYDRATLLLERHFAGEIDYYDCDIRMRHKKGHWIWVHDRGRVATSGGDGQPQWVMGTHTDITARIENARKLREGKEALERTGKIARVGGWSIDLETN